MLHRASAVLLVLCFPLLASAEPSTAPGGERFESQSARITLRGPEGFKMVRAQVGGNELVRFIDEDSKQVIKLTRVQLERGKPVPLTVWKDKDGEHPGMLEFTTEQFKTDTPGAEVLQQEVTDVGDLQVGLMAARFSYGLETSLQQQAIISTGAANEEYFILAMNSPAPRAKKLDEDPVSRAAVETFRRTLDSLKLVDASAVREDQEDRLFRTRTLFLSLTPDRFTRALKPEQWMRYVRDGKDVGYSYVTEETARDLPRRGKPSSEAGAQGVLIGVRSRMSPAPDERIDSESWLFCTFDRDYEAWSNVAYTENKTGKTTSGELGSTRKRRKAIPDAPPEPHAPGEIGKRPTISLTEEYTLEVSKVARNVSSEPITRELPPFYLPQAVGQLLPRIAPMREARTYAFATWVSEAGQLMYRYVDVGNEGDFTLNGQRIRAIPVKDRIGLEGAVTTHYVTFKGEYLGSVNAESHLMILPTDASTLESIWKTVNLTKPGAVEK